MESTRTASGTRPTEAEVLASEALELAFGGHGAERRQLAQEALAKIRSAAEATPRLRAYALCAQAFDAEGRGDLEEAARLSQLSADGLRTAEDAEWRARLELELAVNAGRRGRLDEAEALLARGLSSVRALGLRALEGKFLNGVAMLHMMRGDAARCLDASLEASRLFRRIDDPRGESVAHLTAAHVYEGLGAYPEAMGALTRALEAARSAPTVDASTVVSVQATLAGILATLGIVDDAEALARTALDQPEAAPQSRFQAWGSLGRALSHAGDHEGALEAARRSLELARDIGEDLIVVEALLRLGDAARQAGRWDEAGTRYDEGLAMAAGGGMSRMAYQIGLDLGRALVFEHHGDIGAARRIAESLHDLLETFDSRRHDVDVHHLLSRIAHAENDARQAFEHLAEATRINEEIARAERDARVQGIRSAHQLELEREEAVDVSRDLSRLIIDSQEAERKRVASELHDGLGQRLALLSVEIDLLSKRPPRTASEVASALSGLAANAQAIADQVHSISHQLHPAPLTQLGFVRATRSLCDEIQRLHGVEVRLESIAVPEHLPDDVSLCLYRVIQEALNNAVRHGQARVIDVRVVSRDRDLRLDVIDDGVGFDADHACGSGIGLPGMAERARSLRGTFEIVSRPGQGTRVTVRLPLRAASDRASNPC